jgi:hypothetical protein
MIGFACDVAATMARTRVPELIAEALAAAPEASVQPTEAGETEAPTQEVTT